MQRAPAAIGFPLVPLSPCPLVPIVLFSTALPPTAVRRHRCRRPVNACRPMSSRRTTPRSASAWHVYEPLAASGDFPDADRRVAAGPADAGHPAKTPRRKPDPRGPRNAESHAALDHTPQPNGAVRARRRHLNAVRRECHAVDVIGVAVETMDSLAARSGCSTAAATCPRLTETARPAVPGANATPVTATSKCRPAYHASPVAAGSAAPGTSHRCNAWSVPPVNRNLPSGEIAAVPTAVAWPSETGQLLASRHVPQQQGRNRCRRKPPSARPARTSHKGPRRYVRAGGGVSWRRVRPQTHSPWSSLPDRASRPSGENADTADRRLVFDKLLRRVRAYRPGNLCRRPLPRRGGRFR